MPRSIWSSAAWFALIGPPVGAAIALCLLLASFAFHKLVEPDDYVSLTENLLALFADAAIILAAAYPIGAPGAFAVGATAEIMARKAFRKISIAVATVLVGAAISMLVVYGLDEYVLPHPHGDAAPGLGPGIWLITGGIGGLAAAICSYRALRR